MIKNVGHTAATDVTVAFSAPLDSAILRQHTNGSPLKAPSSIPVLVPGQEWRTFWDFTPARDEADELPDQYVATVSFSDSRGEPIGEQYQYVIDWRILIDRGFVTIYGRHDAAQALREI